MVVAADATWDSIGGGNLEATAVARARAMLADGDHPHTGADVVVPQRQGAGRARRAVLRRRGHHPARTARRRARPSRSSASGHVGLELARILARHDVELHLVDSRAEQASDAALAARHSATPLARVHVHHAPVPELVLGQVPAGTHVLVMTHDHAEDIALCDVALRCCAPRLRRADRLVGQVVPVPGQAGGGGPRRPTRSRGSRRPIGLPGRRRQGPRHHRRERGRRPRPDLRARPRSGAHRGVPMTIYRATVLDTPDEPVHRRRAARRARTPASWCRTG